MEVMSSVADNERDDDTSECYHRHDTSEHGSTLNGDSLESDAIYTQHAVCKEDTPRVATTSQQRSVFLRSSESSADANDGVEGFNKSTHVFQHRGDLTAYSHCLS